MSTTGDNDNDENIEPTENPEIKIETENESPLNTERKKRKKKKRPGDGLDSRPEWYPTRYHFMKEPKKKTKKRKKVKHENDEIQIEVDSENVENEIEPQQETNTEYSARSRHTRFSEVNFENSADHTENNSLLQSMEIDLSGEPPRAQYTETGTVKTARSSIPTLPDVKPHGQGVYVVRPFPPKQVLNMNDPDQIRYGYSARPTACGLTDPWVDLTMDHNVLPRISDRHLVAASPEPFAPKSARKTKKKKLTDGSKMCPTFPVVSMPTTEYDKKTIYYSDVTKLRDQLDKKKMLIHKKRKDDADYEKTKQDFVRLELDSFEKMGTHKRERMRDTYFAYLQNTPGSKRAVQECVKKLR